MVVLHFYKLRIRYSSGTKVRSVPQALFSISIFVRFLLCQKPDNMALEQFSKSTPQAKTCLNNTIFQVVPGTDTYYIYFDFSFQFREKKVVKREEYFPSRKFQFSLCLPLPLLSYLTKFHFRILVKFTRKFEMLCLIFKQKRLSLDL